MRGFARALVRFGREASFWSGAVQASGFQPLILFLPSYGRTGAALLRVYNVAAALRGFGWRCLVVPSTLTLAQRQRVIGCLRPSIICMQGVRHTLNRPTLYTSCPVILDMDDADFHLPHLEGALEASVSGITGAIAGSRYVADWFEGRGVESEVVWTGTPVSRLERVPHANRPPVVAWAQTAPETYTAEAEWVLQVMERLARRCPDMCLRLYDRRAGQSSAFLERFSKRGIRTVWVPRTNYKDYLGSFDTVALGLAPLSSETPFSRGKSFGKALAYMDRHVPVIGSNAGEHSKFFDASTAVISNDPSIWVSEMERLLKCPEARQNMANAAYVQLANRLSTKEAARRVDLFLRKYLT